FVRRREFAVAAEIKKWPIFLLARQRGISSFLLYRSDLRLRRLSLKVTITANTIAQDGAIF
ncbi:hypothetical protein ACVGWC_11245, partial [Enterobacter hormaechei]